VIQERIEAGKRRKTIEVEMRSASADIIITLKTVQFQ